MAITYSSSSPNLDILPYEEEFYFVPYILALLIFVFMSASVSVMYLTGHDLEHLNGKFRWLRRGELAKDTLN